MKRTALLILTLLVCVGAQSQVVTIRAVAIQNTTVSYFYRGITNHLTVAVEGCKHNSIVVSCDSGQITKVDDQGRYSFSAGSSKFVTIYVGLREKNGVRKINGQLFRIKDIPDPTPFFANRAGGTINTYEARAQIAPRATLLMFANDQAFDTKFAIDTCTIIVIRNHKAVFTSELANHQGVRFRDNDAVQRSMASLEDGDRLIFSGITCYGPDEKTRHLTPMEFLIRDAHVEKLH